MLNSIKKKKDIKSIIVLLSSSLFERFGTFSMRGMSVLYMITILKKDSSQAALIVNGTLLSGSIISFIANIIFSRIGLRKSIVLSSILSSLGSIILLASIYLKNYKLALFIIGIGMISGFGGIMQSFSMSSLSDITLKIKRFYPKLSNKLIVYFQWMSNFGIILALVVVSDIDIILSIYIASISLFVNFLILSTQSSIIAAKETEETKSIPKEEGSKISKKDRIAIIHMIILTILISPHLALPARMWTTWYVQGLSMDTNVLSLNIDQSELMIISPIIYSIGIYLSNIIIKSNFISNSLKFVISAICASISSVIILILQHLLNSGAEVNILWHLIPLCFVIFSDCLYLILILNLIQVRMLGNVRLIGFAITNLRFLIGSLINTSISFLAKNNVILDMTISMSLSLVTILPLLYLSFKLYPDVISTLKDKKGKIQSAVNVPLNIDQGIYKETKNVILSTNYTNVSTRSNGHKKPNYKSKK